MCTIYIIGLLNILVNLKGEVPTTALTNQPTDISAYLLYHFNQLVFYSIDPDTKSFPSKPKEGLAHVMYLEPKKGDALTYCLINVKTEKAIFCSNIRPASNPMFPNKRVTPISNGGEESKNVVYSMTDNLGESPSEIVMPKFAPDEFAWFNILERCS